MVLGVKMAEIFEKKHEKPHLKKKHEKESVKIKISKIGLRHVLSWPKLGLEPKCHESGTFGGFGKTRTKFYPISSGFLTLGGECFNVI